jgi:hypothetical protein
VVKNGAIERPFSERAIEEASQRYLQCRFALSETGSIPGPVCDRGYFRK